MSTSVTLLARHKGFILPLLVFITLLTVVGISYKLIAQNGKRLSLLENQQRTSVVSSEIGELQEKVVQVKGRIGVLENQTRSLAAEISERLKQPHIDTALVADVAELRQAQHDFKLSLVSITTAVTTLRSSTTNLPRSPYKPSAQPASKATPRAKPPFVLIAIEHRGARKYAAVAPSGLTDLSQVCLMSEGEFNRGWKLIRINNQQAFFKFKSRQLMLHVP
jgi:hypothetical protein